MSSFLAEARRTLALAGPIIIGQVSQMLMGVTDSIMIGHVGKVPLAASAFANSLFGVVYVAGIGVLVPVAVLVSRAVGGGRGEEGLIWRWHGMALALSYCLIASAGMAVLGTQLDRFGQPPEVVAEIHPYYALIALSLWPALLFQVDRQYAESRGRPMMPMLVMLAGVLLNVLLNWILIYGNLGAPVMGLAGAGWATLASRTVAFLLLFGWVRAGEAGDARVPRRLERGRLREMLHIGVPTAGCLIFESGAFSAAAVMMGWIGATALAAHQIALSCAAFTFMFPLGLSMALSMRLARAVGEGRRERLRTIALGTYALSTLCMGTFALLFAFGGERLAAGFVQEAEVIRLAGHLLLVAAVFQLFDGAQVVGAGALRGLADVKIPTVVTAVAYWGVSLPLGYVLGILLGWGAWALWAALAAGLAVAALCLGWRFARLTQPANA